MARKQLCCEDDIVHINTDIDNIINTDIANVAAVDRFFCVKLDAVQTWGLRSFRDPDMRDCHHQGLY